MKSWLVQSIKSLDFGNSACILHERKVVLKPVPMKEKCTDAQLYQEQDSVMKTLVVLGSLVGLFWVGLFGVF